MTKCTECNAELLKLEYWRWECKECGVIFDSLLTGEVQKSGLQPTKVNFMREYIKEEEEDV